MLLSSLVKTNTTLTEQQLLSLGSAFTAQLKYFSARQMSGSLWSFSRLGGLPSNFSLRDAEGIMMPALATYVGGGVCVCVCVCVCVLNVVCVQCCVCTQIKHIHTHPQTHPQKQVAFQ